MAIRCWANSGQLLLLTGTWVHTLNLHEGNALARLDVCAYIRLYLRCLHLLLELKYDRLAHLYATCIWGKQKRRAERSLNNFTIIHFSDGKVYVATQSELPRPIPRNSVNETTDVHRGSTLITRVIT